MVLSGWNVHLGDSYRRRRREQTPLQRAFITFSKLFSAPSVVVLTTRNPSLTIELQTTITRTPPRLNQALYPIPYSSLALSWSPVTTPLDCRLATRSSYKALRIALLNCREPHCQLLSSYISPHETSDGIRGPAGSDYRSVAKGQQEADSTYRIYLHLHHTQPPHGGLKISPFSLINSTQVFHIFPPFPNPHHPLSSLSPPNTPPISPPTYLPPSSPCRTLPHPAGNRKQKKQTFNEPYSNPTPPP